MKTNYVISWTKAILFGCAMFMLPACNKSSEPVGKGEAEFQITDAPSDDPSIKSVFVTVADIKVDGQSVSGFTKQTIDLKAYQNGDTKLLANGDLVAKSYSSLVLVLDTDMDANGTSPGCYAQTTDNAKYKLKDSGTIELIVNNGWSVAANTKTTFIVDFDLRKSIRPMADQAVRYNFVSQDNLNSSVRLVAKSKTGVVEGSYTEQFDPSADKIVVYAYLKENGFNVSTETQAQGSDSIFFKNAVSSAEVTGGLSGKTFLFPFLEEGAYELHFAAYKKDSGSDTFVFQHMLNSQITANGSLTSSVTVLDGVSISISSVITGIL